MAIAAPQNDSFDTCDAIKVRRSITVENCLDDNLHVHSNVVVEWKQDRASFVALINEKHSDIDAVLQLFQKIWRNLSQLSVDHRLYLPPLYQDSESLSALLKHFVSQLVCREKGALLQSGNMLLNGVQGTGKTTLLKAMVIVVAICCDKFFLIYHNFKNGLYSVGQLIAECVHRFVKGDCEGAFGKYAAKYPENRGVSLRVLAEEGGSYIGIAADEVQQVIVVDDRLSWRIKVMKSLESFARTEMNHVFLILSGSSASLVRLLFRSKRPESLRNFDFDLNASLCERFYVPANRTMESLKLYLSNRYPERQFTDAIVCRMLMTTGGIGRFVHNYVQSESRASSGRKANPRKLYANTATCYFLIANLVILMNSTSFDSMKESRFEGILKCPGVSMKKVEKVLTEIGHYDAISVVDDLVNEGVLYVSDDGPLDDLCTVELAVPQDWQFFCSDGEMSVDDYTLFAASLLMIYGGIENNAGKPFERFVRCRLHQLDSRFHYHGRYLKIVEGLLYVGCYDDKKYSKEYSSVHELVDKNTFQENELFAWEGEVGLDGICIRVKTNNGGKKTQKKHHTIPAFTVDGWQCKGGHCLKSMGGGAMKTFRKTFQDFGTVKDISDSQLNGVLIKAEVGFLTILQSICKSVDQCSIAIGQLMITTTKIGTLAQKSLSSSYQIPQVMISKFPAIASNITLSYSVILHDKDEWFRDMLRAGQEPSLLSLLPPLSEADEGRKKKLCHFVMDSPFRFVKL